MTGGVLIAERYAWCIEIMRLANNCIKLTEVVKNRGIEQRD